MNARPQSLDELREEVLAAPGPVLPAGAGTKPNLSRPPEGCRVVSLAGLTGITDYDPAEFTFTARAGTPLQEVEEAVAAEGQYLPWNPPLAGAGATLGGSVAAGLNGPGRLRFGGLRDFIIGCRLVDGDGQIVSGGGKVVKNAAGFDLPKLLVGSCGRLGALVEVTFKLFPRPAARATLRVECIDFGRTVELAGDLARSALELESIDLSPGSTLDLRLGGLPDALQERVAGLKARLDRPAEILLDQDDQKHWAAVDDLDYLPRGEAWARVKIPVTPDLLVTLEETLEEADPPRRYGVAGHLLHLAWPAASLDDLEEILAPAGLSGLVFDAPPGTPIWVGKPETPGPLLGRVARALDPPGRFLPFPGPRPAPAP